MSDEEINIAIAEACGWMGVRNDSQRAAGLSNRGKTMLVGISPINAKQGLASRGCEWVVPNYADDLNAMHEAEKSIKDSQWGGYVVALWCVTCNIDEESFQWPALGFDACSLDTLVHATARQRAEAFLRTINKWKK
jgi:hypothetical protein